MSSSRMTSTFGLAGDGALLALKGRKDVSIKPNNGISVRLVYFVFIFIFIFVLTFDSFNPSPTGPVKRRRLVCLMRLQYCLICYSLYAISDTGWANVLRQT